MVFQNYALYPHMTVEQNLAFPLRMMKAPHDEIRHRIEETAELLGLRPLMKRRPHQLSGGQRQRVAMGRALVRQPKVFLMDEPLSNLDAKLRVRMRGEITSLQRKVGVTTIYVTHDQIEAMTMGDRLVVLDHGKLQQVGHPQELYDAPSNVFVATFIGSPSMNLFASSWRITGKGVPSVRLGGRALELPVTLDPHVAPKSGGPVVVGLRPEAFVPAERVDESRRVEVLLKNIEELGHEYLLYFDIQAEPVSRRLQQRLGTAATEILGAAGDGGSITMVGRMAPAPGLKVGATITLGLDTRKAHLFDLEGNRLQGG
jgi:multiple sugar transport system ATP-binding protein